MIFSRTKFYYRSVYEYEGMKLLCLGDLIAKTQGKRTDNKHAFISLKKTQC